MRKTKIGVMDFHGSVDITDPCYDKDVWCRMNNVKISEGEYACYVWRHTDKGKYEDGTPYSYLLVGAIGIYRNGDIPRQKDMEEIGSIGVDAGLAGFFHNKPDYSDEEWGRFCDRVRNGDAWLMHNEKKPTPEVPQTGDSSHAALWLALLGLSGIGAVSVLLMRKRKK